MMRMVFMGTPEFAVPSLSVLLDAGYPVVGVITQPDRPAGRGGKMAQSPVKQLAVSRGVPVYQPERIKRPEGLALLRDLAPDLCVTAAFGQILSRDNLAVPPLGTINVHASLLPRYRGAAPINRCLMDGATRTGVTTMFTDPGIDTGDIINQLETPIDPAETAGALTLRLAALGAQLLLQTVRALEAGNCPRTAQDESQATYQPMLKKEDGLLDFSRPAASLVNQIRGVNPWPGAYAILPDGPLKIWSARVAPDALAGQPGEIVRASAKQGLVVACGDGALEIGVMQAPGSKRMEAKAYLMGKPLAVGTVLHG